MSDDARGVALSAACTATARGGAARQAVAAAATALYPDAWAVVSHAGFLARASWVPAPRRAGLTRALRLVGWDSPRAVVRVEEGQLYPSLDRKGRQRRGAYDTPRALAQRAARWAIRESDGDDPVVLDPACGTGALLLAARERGVTRLVGTDLDALALEVASVAVPEAMLATADLFDADATADVVLANPPYVSAERQDKALRRRLQRAYPWLSGRFDLAVPAAECMLSRLKPGGVGVFVLPWGMLCERYGASWRRRWLDHHHISMLDGPLPFEGAGVQVGLVRVVCAEGPSLVAHTGVDARELARLPSAPLDPALRPEDVALRDRVRAASVPLESLARIDTGVVAHGPLGGKERLLHDEPAPGLVPFADAEDFFAGRRRWLDYRPGEMHRPKDPSLFETPKIVVQRVVGRRPARAAVDRSGTYVGHTCTVVVLRDERVDLESLAAMIRSPRVRGLLRIERGTRLDLYPRDVGAMPVPRCWLDGEIGSWWTDLGLSSAEADRLSELGSMAEAAAGLASQG